MNLSQEVKLLCYALMPNHFHLLFKQNTPDGITKLMRRLITAYVMYFNRKYNRTGGLFQNIYKACNVADDSYLLHLSRYIHLNPTKIQSKINYSEFSSYKYYLHEKKAPWLNTTDILTHFNKKNSQFSYRSFVEEYKSNSADILGNMTLEDEDY